MRKFGGLTVFIVLVAAAAVAQIPTSGNIFVGYSYSRTNSVPGNTLSLNGWEGSLEGKFLPWIGIVADFGAGYGKNNNPIPAITCPITGCPSISADVRKYTYLFGHRH